MKTSRRDFLKISAAATAGFVGARVSTAHAPAGPQPAVVPPLAVFEYSQVRLEEGLFNRQFEANRHLLLNLDEDALLKPFRKRQGLPANGPDMGGWYDDSDDFNAQDNFHGFVPGHSFGQYVSGMARCFATTGSQAMQAKVHRLVSAYAETVEPAGKFYQGYRLPGYTFDKTCCGLIDAHQFANDPNALAVLQRSTDAVLPHLPERALSRKEQETRPHKDIAFTWDETYTLPENFFLAYLRSGDARYRELGRRFLYHEFYDALAQDQNALPGKHAYSHVNALSSAMQAYLILGDTKYLRAATNGLRMVHEQSFATGGWGPNEAFVEPGGGQLAASLNSTHASFETPCGAYGQFKITRYLLRVTRDARYGDSMERILYNTIAGAKPILADGTSFYYSDYNNRQAKKVYHRDKWPCCSGTFPQLTSDYGISAYYRSSDGIYVNLFIPSRLEWLQHTTRCKLTQKTTYPKSTAIEFQLELQRPETFAVYLRIPAWTDGATRISVNGKRMQKEIVSGSFLALRRTWKTGDRIEYEISMPLRLEAIDAQNPKTVALLRGPLALFAIGAPSAPFSRSQLLAARTATSTSEDWVAQTDGGPVIFRPFAAVGDETYRLYQEVAS
ncbi:MAG TPA: beta-L-arabinofuranosidase domain-containing protein [Terriglobia bacterium]|jgi:DUF1680 family protein|nr:beta-L-arabinofuranosidase domain-containing protein [Terriglobia bacterium]